MIIHEQNPVLSENMNKIKLRILTSGYAVLDHEEKWKGMIDSQGDGADQAELESTNMK